MEKPKFINFNSVKVPHPEILNWKSMSNESISEIIEEYIN